MEYSHLFQPIYIGKTFIKNRIALAPVNNSTQMDPIHGTVTDYMSDYFVEIARGGTGLIVTGVFKVENEIDRCYNEKDKIFTWCQFNRQSIREITEMVARIHAYGCKIFFQVSAGPGRVMPAAVINSGVTPVSASPNQCFFKPETTCRELTTQEVERIVEAFGEAATFAKQVGIDGFEIHGHEGYLIDQFTTALWNRRTDKYGGGLRERCTFPIEILKAIKRAAGQDFTVTYRTGAKHFIQAPFTGAMTVGLPELGRDIEDTIEMCKILEEAGYDGFSLDTGCYESPYWSHPPYYQPHGCGLELTSAVKKALSVPVISAGRMGIPELAENAVSEGKTDIVAIGRDLMADPYWPNKVAENATEEIRPCLGCHDGCMLRSGSGLRLTCSVNPACSREGFARITQSDSKKKIMVIGGGVAGVEFAITASKRGHEVSVYERSSKLLGHLNEACVPDFKADLKRLVRWYNLQASKSEARFIYNTEVTVDLIDKEKPDIIIVATGSNYALPRVSGIEMGNVVTCCELLRGEREAKGDVLIVGGGLEGTETALWLAQNNVHVTIVEMQSEIIGRTLHRSNGDMLKGQIAGNGVEVLVSSKLVEIQEDGAIIVDANKNIRKITCDTVAIATGVKANDELYKEILGKHPMVYNIGDCKKPRKIHDAIFEGWFLAMNL